MKKAATERNEAGFTLVEVLVATAIGLLVLGALYSTFKVFDSSRGETRKRIGLNADAITAMELLHSDIGSAGYSSDTANPSSLPICKGNFSNGIASAINAPCLGVQYASINRITVAADTIQFKNITYDIYESKTWETTVLGRATGFSSHQPVVSLRGPGVGIAEYLRLEYFNENGSTATTLENIRSVRAMLTIFWTDDSSHNYTLDISTKNIGYR
jgi:prepilin-type N-terminal cleavage/methylation domain-containing protein